MRLALALAALCVAAFVLVGKVEPSRNAVRPPAPPQPPVVHRMRHAARRRPARPPQFVVVSFDGSGGIRLWPYWRAVAHRAGAHFTFFVSGVYLVPEEQRMRYHAPRHRAGASDIWLARPDVGFSAAEVVRRTRTQIARGCRAG